MDFWNPIPVKNQTYDSGISHLIKKQKLCNLERNQYNL